MWRKGKLALTILLMLAACAPSGLQRPRADACEIYKTAWDARDKTGVTYLRNRTDDFPYAEERDAPRRWRRSDGTGRELEIDTTTMFERLRSTAAQSTHACFENHRDPPPELGELSEASSYETLQRLGGKGTRIWTLSPVAFSADGEEAMFVHGSSCGVVCGAGVYILMRKTDGKWQEVATSLAWVS